MQRARAGSVHCMYATPLSGCYGVQRGVRLWPVVHRVRQSERKKACAAKGEGERLLGSNPWPILGPYDTEKQLSTSSSEGVS